MISVGSESEQDPPRMARPKSAMAGRPPSRLQPPSAGKRVPHRGPATKPEPRAKPAPVTIQVGAASLRAALNKSVQAGPSNSTLLSAMKDSFAPVGRPPSVERTLHTSQSAPALKKAPSNTSVRGKAMVDAKKVGSTVDEKKKEENRRLIEARREENRRKEAAAMEEKKRGRQEAGPSGRNRTVERVGLVTWLWSTEF